MNIDSLNELKTDMAHNNIPCDSELNFDGVIHRYSASGNKSDKSEWYVGYQGDNYIYCTYGSWKSEEKFTYRSGHLSQDQIDFMKKEITELQKATYSQVLARQQSAKLEAEMIIQKCERSCNHKYVRRKGITQKVMIYEDFVIVPFVDIENNVHSLQKIDPLGEKRFLKGGKIHGCFTYFNGSPNPSNIFVCEGFATAWSISKATHDLVVMAGSLNNIDPVTDNLKRKYPNAAFNLCQDIGEAPDKHAAQWKQKYQGTVYKPNSSVSGFDFNDQHQQDGIESVTKTIQQEVYQVEDSISAFKKEYKKPEWILENLLMDNSSLMIHADSGVGKSMLALEMALSLADGTKFLKWWPSLGKKRILYIDSELSMNMLMSRMKETKDRRGTKLEEGSLGILSTIDVESNGSPIVNLYDPRVRNMLDRSIMQYDVIFLDNLQNLTFDTDQSGRENKAEYWQLVGEWIKKWKKRGKTFVVVHHENKVGGMRGSTRISADFDQIMRLEKPEKLEDDHEGFLIKLHPYKLRGAEQKHQKPFWAHLKPMPELPRHNYEESDRLRNWRKFRGWYFGNNLSL